MTARADTLGLDPQEIVEMFIYDDRNIGGAQVLYWHSGTRPGPSNLPVVWQGQSYEPFPIEANGFDQTAADKLPRPNLRLSNIGGYIGAYLRTIEDGLGAKITRKRTFGKYMDAVNFPAGNPGANPAAGLPDEIYYIARKMSANTVLVELELSVAFDVRGVMLPRRQILATTCQWVYRSAGCSYNGPPVQDINGNPTTDSGADMCNKSLNGCRARFKTGALKTSAMPASMLSSYA